MYSQRNSSGPIRSPLFNHLKQSQNLQEKSVLDMFRFSLKYFFKTFFVQMNIWTIMIRGGNGRSCEVSVPYCLSGFGQNWNIFGKRQTLPTTA
jgi:hypothetical protein